jgi:hypothetical protein
VACGKTRSSEHDESAGDSSIDGAVSGGTGAAGVNGTGAQNGRGGIGAGGGNIIILPPSSGGRAEPTGVVAGSGVMPTGRACVDFEDRIGCRQESDCPPPSAARHRVTCVWDSLIWDDCGRPRTGMLYECQPACENGELCMPDGICGHKRCRLPCPDVACESDMRCDASVCIPRGCEEDGGSACSDDQVCDPSWPYSTNHCVPVQCADGFECRVWQACGTSGGDLHGCVPLPCRADDDCACGYCVEGRCAPTLGLCFEEMIAMPYGCVWPDEEWV